MYLLLWIIGGLIAGWLAGRSLEGNGYGPAVDLAMGAGGAVIGGYLMRWAGFSGYGGTILTALVAICSAALFTILAAVANGRTVYTKDFSL